LERDTYKIELWSFDPEPGGNYRLIGTILPFVTKDIAIPTMTAADLARYHMSPTGQYIVFEGVDEIDHLFCLLGGYSRIFTYDPQARYVPAVLPIWRGGTYTQFRQALYAAGPMPTFTTTPSGVDVLREAPVCAGNHTAVPSQ
jgi:hypothetical protein